MTQPAAGGLLSRFAHLTGGIAAKAKAEDEDDKDRKDAAEGDDEEKDEKDDKKDDARADDEDDARAEDEEGEEEKPAKDNARRASHGRVKSKTSAAAIRLSERNRCAAIFAHPGAAHNPTLAAELAFNTDLPATAAAALLAASPAPARQGLAARMATVPAIKVGADAAGQPQTEADEARALASRIIAGARASGVIRS